MVNSYNKLIIGFEVYTACNFEFKLAVMGGIQKCCKSRGRGRRFKSNYFS